MYENLEEMRVAPNGRGIPSNTQTFMEQSMYVAYEIESGFNRFMMRTGINELNSFIESGGDIVVYEGARFDEFKNKAIEFFKSILAKIKAAYENAVNKFNEMINNLYAKQAAKFRTITKNDLDEYLTDEICEKKIGNVHLFSLDKFDKARHNIVQFRKMIENGFKSNDKDDVDSKAKDLESKMVKFITGEDHDSIAAAVKSLKKDAENISPATKDFIKILYQKEIVGDKISGIEFKKNVKTVFKHEKDNIDKAISEIKKHKNEDTINIIAAQIKLFKTLSSANHIICSGFLDCITKQTRYTLVTIFKTYSIVQRKKNGANKSGSTNEAYSYSDYEINQADYIASLGSTF